MEFGKHSGPGALPKKTILFGQSSPLPPPASSPAPPTSPLPLRPFQPPAQAPISHSIPAPSPSRRPEAVQQMQAPFMHSESNALGSRPTFLTPTVNRPNQSILGASVGQRPFYQDNAALITQRPRTSIVAPRNSGTSITARIARFPDPQENDLPLHPVNRDILRNSSGNFIPSQLNAQPQARPSLSYEDIYAGQDSYPSSGIGQGRRTSIPRTVRSPPVALRNNFSQPEAPCSEESLSPYAAPQRPPLSYEDIYAPEDSHPFDEGRRVFNGPKNMASAPQTARSPPLPLRNNYSPGEACRSEAPRPVSNSSMLGNRAKAPGNYNRFSAEDFSSDFPVTGSYDSRNGSLYVDDRAQSGTRSPPCSLENNVSSKNLHFTQDNSTRISESPISIRKREIVVSRPQSGIRSNALSSSLTVSNDAVAAKSSNFPATKRSRSPSLLSSTKELQHNQNASPSSTNVGVEAPIPSGSPVPKRTRSPSFLSDNQDLLQNSHGETEREMQAKAKRLARFNVELSKPAKSGFAFEDQEGRPNRTAPTAREKGNLDREEAYTELPGSFPSTNPQPDIESEEPSSIIMGLCPDMCPETERAERERKGDLDRYERVDGDRNQTSQSLAVKKYTRTAEREANLIRPLPVLQSTMDYLLSLLDQPYDDRFLGIYNFLWDRMRAVRMDLRMQHIFNLESVKMLEQMIRLHIIAMHELCEYEKGEGFSEGFDAHLNIEQMNKASAELFQLYDDHRKKGINIPTEKEFRGYYALLKLDRHPGYKVEPGELSLDLAKMTPEIRQTSEVRFARDVARACRTSNVVSFFRLARKASYVQACLMHAHFAKLRSQALASLHSGLQNNQGLPVSVVARWLAMEEEDIEDLLQYHGFQIKEYEEPYMVKEGSFLQGDKEYPTKCSMLVHLKKSTSIVDDVSSSQTLVPPKQAPRKKIQLEPCVKLGFKAIQSVGKEMSLDKQNKESVDIRAISSPKERSRVESTAVEPNQNWNSSGYFFSNHPMVPTSPKTPAPAVNFWEKAVVSPRSSVDVRTPYAEEVLPSQVVPTALEHEMFPGVLSNSFQNSFPANGAISDFEPGKTLDIYQENEADVVEDMYQENEPDLDMVQVNEEDGVLDDDDEVIQVAEAKLRLILRLWKRRSVRKRELREQRQLVAADALNSLTLGPPIHPNKEQNGIVSQFDINYIAKERYGKQELSWSRLNVAQATSSILSSRNPNAKFLAWKITVCSEPNVNLAAFRWLRAKTMPTAHEFDDDDDDLILSTPGVSIWRNWVSDQPKAELTCCLSIIKDLNLGDQSESLLGTSAVLFLVYESIPLETQRTRLHNVLNSLPAYSQIPLLILSDSTSPDIVNSLRLHEINRSRLGSVSVTFLAGHDQQMGLFFSDEKLREGLQWLARESPVQPDLQSVQARKFVLDHLMPSSISKTHPQHYISAFNEALDQSSGKLLDAVNENRINWPCPEIDMLDEFSVERSVASCYLPRVGWSRTEQVEPILNALRECKLADFTDDISWLERGCHGREEIEAQRLLLEDCLVRYLSQMSNVTGNGFWAKEASLIIQKNARLKLHGSGYYIVPNWEKMFRRVFHWRLMSLSREDVSQCYVLEREVVTPSDSHHPDGNEEDVVMSHNDSECEYPRLDELVGTTLYSVSEPPAAITGEEDQANGSMESRGILNGDDERGDNYSVGNNSYSSDSMQVCVAAEEKVQQQTDKLSRLLEQCNMVQNVIDEKLSFYF